VEVPPPLFHFGGHQTSERVTTENPQRDSSGVERSVNELEGCGLVTKKVNAELPLKVEYRLTAFGNSVIPVITALGKWGDDHQDQLRRKIAKSNRWVKM